MTSLIQQMTQTNRQQEILEKKVEELEELRVRIVSNTLENLELKCNNYRHTIQHFKCKKNPLGSDGRTTHLARLVNIDIFENLLDVVKKQDERIRYLEDKCLKI